MFLLVSYTLFHLLTFALVFLSAGAFAFILHSFCYRLLLFVQIVFRLFCLFVSLRSCAGLHRWLLGSEATVVFVGVSCGEPDGNEQMAHSQIVVVIVFPFSFEVDVVSVLHQCPLGSAGFHCRFQSPFTIICFGMLSFAFVCFDVVSYSWYLAGSSFGFLQFACICLCSLWFF